MRRFAFTIFILILAVPCFARTDIKVGKLSYSIHKKTKPIELFPAAAAYPKTGGGYLYNVRFPGYKYFVAVNGSSFYPGWTGSRNSTSGILTVTSPRGFTYTFDNGYNPADPNTAALNAQCTELKITGINDPNGDSKGIYIYDVNDRIYQIKQDDSANSVYMQFGYNSNRIDTITTVDPSVSASSANYSRIYSITYDANDRVIAVTNSQTGGCGCGGVSQDWLTDVYDANSKLIAQKNSLDETIYSYNHHSNGRLKEKLNKDGDIIKKIEYVNNANGTKTIEKYKYVDANNYRYSEMLIGTDGYLESETVFEELRDNRVDPNLYDTNSFTTTYLYNGDDRTTIPDGAPTNGTGVRTVYDYDSEGNLLHEYQYDSTGSYRTVVSNSYSNDMLTSSTDIRGLRNEYDRVTGLSLIDKEESKEGSTVLRYRKYYYNSKNQKIKEELSKTSTSDVVETINYEYDNYGNLCKQYRNDNSDRSDANSMVTEYVYNAFGDMLWQINPDDSVTGKVYDAYGRLTDEFTLADGYADFSLISNPLDCTYTSLEVISQKSYTYNSINGKLDTVYTAIDNDTFYFDSPDSWSQTKYNYDDYGRKTSEVQGYGDANLTTSYQYNFQDEVEVTTYADSHTVEIIRDGRDLTVDTIKSGGSESITTSNIYDGDGRLEQILVNDIVISSYEYDDFGRQEKSYKGSLTSSFYTEYLYDDNTDDIETQKLWDASEVIAQTEKAYDVFGRVIYSQQLEDLTSGADSQYDKITFHRYDCLGNMTMTANLGVGNSFYPMYGYNYAPDEYSNTGDIVELRKYNDNSQLSAVIKFVYPEIIDTDYGQGIYEFFDANLADTLDYIQTNDPNVSYTKYDYANSQIVGQYQYAGLDPNTKELTFIKTSGYQYYNSGLRYRIVAMSDSYTQSKYNSLGASIEQIICDVCDVAVYKTATEYDSLGRTKRQITFKDPNAATADDETDKIVEYIYDTNGYLEKQCLYTGYLDSIVDMSVPGWIRYEPITTDTVYGYDAIGRRITTTDPMGNQQIIDYNDIYGKVASKQTISISGLTGVSDLTATTYYDYDFAGRLVSVTEPGRTASSTYDYLGNFMIEETMANGVINSYEYDGFGNRITETKDDTGITQITEKDYDRHGRLKVIAGASNGTTNQLQTTYHYDYLNNIVQIDYPDSTSLAFDYDIFGKVIKRTDRNNLETEYTYDASGRLYEKNNIEYIQVADPCDANETITVADSKPWCVYYRDTLGRLTSTWLIQYDANENELQFATHSRTYDGLGNITQTTDGIDGGTATTGYTYLPNGRLHSVTYPDGYVVNYDRDDAGKITAVKGNNSTIVNYDYLGKSVLHREFPAIDVGILNTIDARGRITAEDTYDLSSETDITTTDYTFVTNTDYIYQKTIDAATETYGYDDLGRLTSFGATSYTLDDLGYRSSPATDSQTYITDTEDRVVEVNDASQDPLADYAYDSLGRRISKTIDNVKTSFVYDIAGNVITEYQDSDWARNYIYGATGEAVYMALPKTSLMSEDTDNLISFCDAWLCYPSCDANDLDWDYNNDDQINFTDWAGYCDDFALAFRINRRYLLTDYRNTVKGVVDSNGASVWISYNPWGLPSYTDSIEGLSVMWNGYYYDNETDNYYLRNRYMSPTSGLFITEDPHGIKPDDNWNNKFDIFKQYADSINLNLYANANPISNRDDWGLKNCGLMIYCGSILSGGIEGDIGNIIGARHCALISKDKFKDETIGRKDIKRYRVWSVRNKSRRLGAGPKKDPCNCASCPEIKKCVNEAQRGKYSCIGNNCQSSVADAINSCCLKTNWKPAWHARRKMSF